MPPPGSVIRPIVDRFLIANGIGAIVNQVETVSMAFGRSYTRASNAIWIISEGVVTEDLVEGRLRSLPLDTAQTSGPVGLTKRTDGPLSLPAELLAKAIRDVARAL
jgi:LysR family pca operon transcriptional activator